MKRVRFVTALGMFDRVSLLCEYFFNNWNSGTGADLSNTSVPFALPGQPGGEVTDYPEG